VRCCVGCPPCPAGWAHAAFAGKRDKLLEAARWTTNAGEALVEEAAVDVLAELALDKGRVAMAVIEASPAICQESLEVVSDNDVQGSLLGLVASVVAARKGEPCDAWGPQS
jgi:hypothetical protein